MKENPANAIKDSMWDFLKDGSHEANIEGLKDGVYTLIKMTTQKDAGQRGKAGNVPFDMLEMVKWQIICEATALVLSGELDKLKTEEAKNEFVEKNS